MDYNTLDSLQLSQRVSDESLVRRMSITNCPAAKHLIRVLVKISHHPIAFSWIASLELPEDR